MSDLEGMTKPVLGPLIAAGPATTTLQIDDQATLARWAFKTALMFDLSVSREDASDFAPGQTGDHPAIHRDAYRAFYQNRTMGPALVWMGGYLGRYKIGGGRQTYTRVYRLLPGKQSPASRDLPTLYFVIHLLVGRVYFRVMGPLPGAQLIPSPVAGRRLPGLIRIFPRQDDIARWPSAGVYMKDAAVEALTMMADF